jgi:hypothetical protein
MSSSEEAKCPLCKRQLGLKNVDEHHLVPKTFKGRETVTLHRICHRKIHATFTERELLNHYNTLEKLLEHDHIRSFVSWVARKPPEYYDGSKETAERKSKRRR